MEMHITAEQREEVEQQLQRTDLTRRMRERLEMVKAAALGDDVARIARWSGRSVARVEHWLRRFATGGVAALADAPRSGRPVAGGCRLSGGPGAGAGDPAARAGPPLRRLDLAATRGLSGAADGRPYLPGLAAGALGAAGLGVRPTQTHAQAPADPGRGRRLPHRAGGAGGKRCGRSRQRYELHYQDETHLETNPYLCRVWHRRGTQPTLPGVGTNRRVTVFGSVEALGRTRIELVRAAQDTAGFVRYLELLEAHQQAVQREIYLVLDNGSAHTSQVSLQALAARQAWLHVLWLAKYAPQLNPKEREWRRLKRDARSHLAADLRAFIDAILTGLDTWVATYAQSWTRCPTGFSRATASRLRDAAPAVPWGQRQLQASALSPKTELTCTS